MTEPLTGDSRRSDEMRGASSVRIVLASTSPWRAELMRQLKIDAEIMDPAVDEGTIQAADLAPEEVAVSLAELKALAVAQRLDSGFVIGADQVVHKDGELLTKPESLDEALAQLMRLQGGCHHMVTGVCIVDARSGRSVRGSERHTLTMHSWGEDVLRAYVERDNPIGCAGGAKIESLGIALYADLQGRDYTSIIGLPLMLLADLLRQLGVEVLR